MKKLFARNMTFLLLLTLVFSSCGTEEIEAQLPQNTLDQNLKGSWELESYTINGAEQIGGWIISSNMDFQGLDGDLGTVYWQNVTPNDDTPVPFYYSVSEVNSRVYIKNDEYTAQFKGEQLHLKGLINGISKEIVANKVD